jgi:hypothetical protein
MTEAHEQLHSGAALRAADKPCHQRELLVLAPDGELIAFGMAMPQAEVAKA